MENRRFSREKLSSLQVVDISREFRVNFEWGLSFHFGWNSTEKSFWKIFKSAEREMASKLSRKKVNSSQFLINKITVGSAIFSIIHWLTVLSKAENPAYLKFMNYFQNEFSSSERIHNIKNHIDKFKWKKKCWNKCLNWGFE